MAESTRTLDRLDLVGGDPSLDFANTVNSRVSTEHDYIRSFDDLVAWSARAGLMPDGSRRAAALRASADPGAAVRTTRTARRLREAVYRVFSAIASGKPVPRPDALRVIRAYGIAVGRASISQQHGRTNLAWPVSDPSRVLDPIAYAAGALLLATDRPPIRECPGCRWLFLDRSRNGSRRWCDMQTCGSRDKMRRYYRSRQAAASGFSSTWLPSCATRQRPS